jgi:hypothetical protein
VGVNFDERVLATSGPYAFKIYGALSHRMGGLLPLNNERPAFAQLYILDPAEASTRRGEYYTGLNAGILGDIQNVLETNNPYVQLYKQAYDILASKPPEEQDGCAAQIVVAPNTDIRCYNLPTSVEIAAIIPGSGEENIQENREIILRLRQPRADDPTRSNFKRISHLHALYTPLHYVLLFPSGETGWHTGIPAVQVGATRPRSPTVSQRCYYAYRIHWRTEGSDMLFRAGRLFQQYVVDAWASVEESNLCWIRLNQKDLKADTYQVLCDAVAADAAPDDQGHRFILPSSHAGSPRHMNQLFQDSMAICRFCQKPDIFLTMTANPKWPEVQEALLKFQVNVVGENGQEETVESNRRQESSDRPDIIARVFNEKMDSLLTEIKGGLFGAISGLVYTIEFQKRGLPHIHLLIFLQRAHKIRDADHVNSLISAKLPDPNVHPILWDAVTRLMLHGICGASNPRASCMKDGNCSRHFPKSFNPETRFGEDGYPEYARPNDGRTFTDSRGQIYDNRRVVPHNPYLLAKYNCHINVEVCASIKAVKYIHKYIYKGPDRATLEVGNLDEIKQYIDSRYIGPVEACWHILEFPRHLEFPAVYRLPVHVKNEQMVYFDPEDNIMEVANRPSSAKTQLTEWFTANQDLACIAVGAQNYTYQEFPQHMVWVKSERIWKPRKQGSVIGRMYFVAPNAGERFYLRTLLTVI